VLGSDGGAEGSGVGGAGSGAGAPESEPDGGGGGEWSGVAGGWSPVDDAGGSPVCSPGGVPVSAEAMAGAASVIANTAAVRVTTNRNRGRRDKHA
jgi:hypothetical protein